MLTAQQAYDQTASDPAAYNLAADATEEQVTAARERAAQALMAGSAANDAYWNSRGELEQVIARAQGHGVVQRGEDAPTGVGTSTAPVIDATAVPETAPAEVPAATGDVTSEAAPVGTVGETPGQTGPAPSPDNPNETIARLRAQVEGLGETPEA